MWSVTERVSRWQTKPQNHRLQEDHWEKELFLRVTSAHPPPGHLLNPGYQTSHAVHKAEIKCEKMGIRKSLTKWRTDSQRGWREVEQWSGCFCSASLQVSSSFICSHERKTPWWDADCWMFSHLLRCASRRSHSGRVRLLPRQRHLRWKDRWSWQSL